MVLLIALLIGGTRYKQVVRELKDSQIKTKQLEAELEDEVIELQECQVQKQQLEAELEAEVSGMLKVGESGSGLGVDFGFQIHDTDLHGEMMRFIKVQCPGVDHADVEIELITNGCIVSVQRFSPEGGDAATWRRRFQFRPSEGLFEFKEDQMQLEKGFLHLVFRRYSHQSRVIRFPHHFSLAATDTDQCWEYAADDAVGDDNEAGAWWYEAQASAFAHKQAQHSQYDLALHVDMDTMSTASTARASA